MDNNMAFRQIEGNSFGFYSLLTLFMALIAAGLGAAYYMEHQGHYVTGMNNQVVWGMPHIFAVFLIVTASGALTCMLYNQAPAKVARITSTKFKAASIAMKRNENQPATALNVSSGARPAYHTATPAMHADRGPGP